MYIFLSPLLLLFLSAGVPTPTSLPSSLSNPELLRVEKLEKKQEPRFRVYLEPRQKTLISSEITALVEKIPKRMGQHFREGDLLVGLSSSVFESNYLKGVKILERAEIEEAAARKLYDDDAISLIELKAAQAQLATATADFSQAQKLYESTRVFAPYSGKVVKIMINEFELAQPGKEIMEIIDEEFLYARFLAPGNLITEFSPGRKVKIHLDDSGEDIDGIIKRVSPVIDAVSNTVKVEAEIDNSEGRFVPGMAGTLRFDHALSDSEFYPFIKDDIALNNAEYFPPPQPGDTFRY